MKSSISGSGTGGANFLFKTDCNLCPLVSSPHGHNVIYFTVSEYAMKVFCYKDQCAAHYKTLKQTALFRYQKNRPIIDRRWMYVFEPYERDIVRELNFISTNQNNNYSDINKSNIEITDYALPESAGVDYDDEQLPKRKAISQPNLSDSTSLMMYDDEYYNFSSRSSSSSLSKSMLMDDHRSLNGSATGESNDTMHNSSLDLLGIQLRSMSNLKCQLKRDIRIAQAAPLQLPPVENTNFYKNNAK
jgi:hypothetical protein